MRSKIVEHKNAYFEDEDGIVHKYHYSKLTNEEFFASLKGVDLSDKSKLLRLTPRKHESTPHFKEIPGNTNRIIFTCDSETHDTKIEDITTQLNKVEKSRILSIKTVKSSDYSFQLTPLIKIHNYLWNSEVVKSYSNEMNFRHDISGFDLEGCQTKSKPLIIIEVIDTHFIEREVYNMLLSRSLRDDAIILFYILPNESKYNFIKTDSLEIKVSCYIKGGKFYYGNKYLKKIENPITQETSNNYAEFYYVKEFVIDKLRNGKYIDLKMFE